MSTIYIIYGIFLVFIFVAVIVYCYHPKRKDDIETPKYRMFDDDDR